MVLSVSVARISWADRWGSFCLLYTSGFLISPNFTYLPTVVESADIHVWANIGVVFLMFGLGLEFSFKKLATVGGSAFIVALTVMGAMVLIGTGVGSLLGWGKMDCIFLGCMLSMSSTMIILKAYEEDGLKEKKFAQLILSTLIIEDIVGIFMMIIPVSYTHLEYRLPDSRKSRWRPDKR